jgi:hypothetical protein
MASKAFAKRKNKKHQRQKRTTTRHKPQASHTSTINHLSAPQQAVAVRQPSHLFK